MLSVRLVEVYMNKKILVISVSVLLVIVAVTISVLACWQPYSLKGCESIALHYNDKDVVLTQDNTEFAKIEKLIKRTLNSSRFNMAFASDRVKMQCTDKNVEEYKISNYLWIEISANKGKYRKLFFVINEAKDMQFIMVFATQKDSYDNGNFLLYNNCNCTQLIDLLKSI